MAFRFSPRTSRAQEIAWRAWSEAAFAEARHEGKPVLLAISAVWCHWCHVMDETSYSDPDVIRIINERFIPVRVDNDQRPDINSRYNLGGWPTTAFLSSEGELLAGGTYFPPRAMKQMLSSFADRWETDRTTLEQELVKPERPQLTIAPSPALLEEKGPLILAAVAQAMTDDFDLELGGFGRSAKFPVPFALEFLLAWRLHRQANSESVEGVDQGLSRTLDAIAGGGLRDKIEGGFFRYCTKRDWTEPHYEKMLEDNAGLIRAYLAAGSIFGNTDYHDLAAQTIDYIDRLLTDSETGSFLGSQDADESYYLLPLIERTKVPEPQSDPTIYADWNALMSLALLEAAPVLEEPGLIDRALRALDFQASRLTDESGAVAHFYDGKPQLFGLLSDQAWTILAFLRAFEQSQQSLWLRRAESVARFVLDRLLDREAGGFFDRPAEPEAGLVAIPVKPVTENGRIAEALIRLTWHTGNEIYRQQAGRALAVQLDDLPQYGTFAASSGLALLLYLSTPVQIEVFGNPKDRSLWEQLRRALASPEPARFVRSLNVSQDNIELGARRFDEAVLGAYFRSSEQRNGLKTQGRTVEERMTKVFPPG